MLVRGLSDTGKFLFASSGAGYYTPQNANIFLFNWLWQTKFRSLKDDTLHTQWILLVLFAVLAVTNENGKEAKKWS